MHHMEKTLKQGQKYQSQIPEQNALGPQTKVGIKISKVHVLGMV